MNLNDRVKMFLGKNPQIADSAYLAASAELIGDVRVGPDVSIWPKCVLRADINFIEIGAGTNLQDGTLVHLSDDYPVIIGKNVTVGHGAMLHACTIEDECLIGMRATILDGAIIGMHSIIGANALVSKGMIIPPGSLVLGIPAKVTRILTQEEKKSIYLSAEKYKKLFKFHKERL